MPLVFAAVTPHPPILIEHIGKGAQKKIQKTQESLDLLEQELYLSKPSVIIAISPHGSIFEHAFCVNAHTNFISAYEEFGDFTTKDTWQGAPDMAAHISHQSLSTGIPVQLISEGRIDHGTSIPLHSLTRHLPDVRILPIGYSLLDSKSHLAFGAAIKEVIMNSDKRVAIIASADLSHALSDQSPAGHHVDGKKFDEQIISLLETRNTKGIADFDDQFVNHASACGYRSILLLLGVLQHMQYTFKNYTYETPFGVGYLTGQFVF
jgi:aromatic ring-opening dioxygenase LigB subunit